jgi:RNA polymerase sigma-70 factor (ECF subfamily)
MSNRDQELMLSAQAGDHASFAELVDRFRPRLLRFALSSLRDSQLAEDLVQEAFLAVYQSRQTYNPTFAVSTWVWTILLNLVHRTRERIARRQKREAASPRVRPAHSPLVYLEDREQLDYWLSLIPEAEADALRLRFFGELSFDQIAASMESSVSGAKVRVKNGLERLSELARNELQDTPRSEGSSGEMR